MARFPSVTVPTSPAGDPIKSTGGFVTGRHLRASRPYKSPSNPSRQLVNRIFPNGNVPEIISISSSSSSSSWFSRFTDLLFVQTMATAMLRYRDLLGDRLHGQTLTPPTLKSRRNPNRRQNPNPSHRQNPSPNPHPDPNPNLNPNSKQNSSSRFLRRKRSPASPRDGGAVVAKVPARNLLVEKVTILKRGEKLSSNGFGGGGGGDLKDDRVIPPVKGEKDLVLCSTDRLGPDPETVQKQVRVLDVQKQVRVSDVQKQARVSEFNIVDCLYAGSAFADSPPPSSLPFPAFAKKEKGSDSATSDLRRLLRLDVLSR